MPLCSSKLQDQLRVLLLSFHVLQALDQLWVLLLSFDVLQMLEFALWDWHP